MKRSLSLLALTLVTAAQAQIITIDQAKALAGNVTPGDAPGFPITISQPGSYRVTGSLTVSDLNTPGIVIAAPNVTLDLSGFTLAGGRCGPSVCAPGVSGAHGLRIETAGVNARVMNGTVDGFGSAGVSSSARGTTLVNLTLRRHGGSAAVFMEEFLIQDSRLMDLSSMASVLHYDRGTIRRVEFDATPGNVLSILSSDGNPVLLDGNRFRNSAIKAFTPGRAVSAGNNMCNTAAC